MDELPWGNVAEQEKSGLTLCDGRPGPRELIVDKRLVSGNADAIMYGYIRESA
jgi:hypothetical protein